MARWRILAVVVALVAYAWASHLLMVHAPAKAWTVAALFGPLLAAMAVGGFKRRHGPTLFGCAALAIGLAAAVARGGVDVNRLYVLQHAGMHLALAAVFAVTLRPGSKPLITALGERVHEHFTPPMRAYTRWLTGAWVVYFIGMVVVSLAIYAFAPWSWWSLFSNVITPLAAIAFFVGETLLRQFRHPEFERVSLAGVVRAYKAQRS